MTLIPSIDRAVITSIQTGEVKLLGHILFPLTDGFVFVELQTATEAAHFGPERVSHGRGLSDSHRPTGALPPRGFRNSSAPDTLHSRLRGAMLFLFHQPMQVIVTHIFESELDNANVRTIRNQLNNG